MPHATGCRSAECRGHPAAKLLGGPVHVDVGQPYAKSDLFEASFGPYRLGTRIERGGTLRTDIFQTSTLGA
jgi:hypothetical protein